MNWLELIVKATFLYRTNSILKIFYHYLYNFDPHFSKVAHITLLQVYQS